jgi:hypothetical protein
MTTLRFTHDLWQSFSMSPYEVSLLPLRTALFLFICNAAGTIKHDTGTIPYAQ